MHETPHRLNAAGAFGANDYAQGASQKPHPLARV